MGHQVCLRVFVPRRCRLRLSPLTSFITTTRCFLRHQDIAAARERLMAAFGSLEIPVIAPYVPMVIAGECIPPRQNHQQQQQQQEQSARPPHPPLPSGASGEGKSHIGYENSALSDLHFTQESYAARVALEMQKQELFASMGITGFASSTSDEYAGAYSSQQGQHSGGGRGGGRGGRGRGQGQAQDQHSYYGPGSALSNANTHHQDNSHGGRGRGGRGGGRGGSNKAHSVLFNPTSRVTPLGNHQTDAFLQALGLSHIWTRPCEELVPATAPANKAGATTAHLTPVVSAPAGATHTTKVPDAASNHPAGSSDTDSSSRASTGSTVHQSGIHTLSLAPQLVIPAQVSAPVDDKYGLHAYYGATASYHPATNSTTNSTSTDPLELDIDDDEDTTPAPTVPPAAVASVVSAPVLVVPSMQLADPSELDLDAEETVERTEEVSAQKEEDPNAIDLDF